VTTTSRPTTTQPGRLRVNDVTVTERDLGTVSATFTVSLTSPSDKTVTVDFATADGTATQPADYSRRLSALTFSPGSVTGTVTVVVNGDRLPEADETFTLRLSNPKNAVIADGVGIGTIVDDEPVTIGIADERMLEGDRGTRNMEFTITLSKPATNVVKVAWKTANGTATAPADYTAKSGTASIKAGKTTALVKVPIVGDTKSGPNETFRVRILNATGAAIADDQAVGTILNDD
jgi:chitinase